MSDSPPGSSALVDTLIGRQIGSYVVEHLLGAGGMGSVYRGVQPAIGKRVAIKFLAPHLNGSVDVVARFFDEAKAVNLIGNENIVDIFDFGKTPDGQNFFVMELLDGPSLEKALEKAKALSPARAVNISAQIARALAAAHERGIIHRDLKPDNVFLVRRVGHDDFVKVVDFGIAKLAPPEGAATGEADRRTKSGMILGTPGYMAPEQASGDPVDGRADVYALGVLLYRMLTGVVPFAAQSFTATLLRQLTETPRRVSELRSDVPRELDDLVSRMLARLPAERPATMGEVADALTAISVGPLGHDVAWIADTPQGREQRAELSKLPTSLEAPLTQLEHVPPPPRRRGPPLAALVGVGVAAVAVPLFLVLHRAPSRLASPDPAPSIAAQVDAAPTTVANPLPPAPPPPAPPTTETTGAFTVRIESTPEGAQIFRGDELVGTTPVDLRFDAVGPVTLKLAGYHEERLELHRDDGTVRAALKKRTQGLPHLPHPGGISLDD